MGFSSTFLKRGEFLWEIAPLLKFISQDVSRKLDYLIIKALNTV